ncbi:MAG TPA: hypothetical protein GXZ82_07650 [Firmicutes bacterium]|nr:hypothetical protein [Bacillota bacterium]
MGLVRSVFLNEQQARIALERLRAVFTDDQLQMQALQVPRPDVGSFAGAYDPLAPARLSGAIYNTMPATGANLVGNSTTLDLNLSEFDDLLAMVAEAEQRGQYRRSTTRIIASVQVETVDEAETAREIMAECGGRDLSLDKRDLSSASPSESDSTDD